MPMLKSSPFQVTFLSGDVQLFQHSLPQTSSVGGRKASNPRFAQAKSPIAFFCFSPGWRRATSQDLCHDPNAFAEMAKDSLQERSTWHLGRPCVHCCCSTTPALPHGLAVLVRFGNCGPKHFLKELSH